MLVTEYFDHQKGCMIYQSNDISLDTRLYQLKINDDLVSVEPKVFDLLLFLVENRDRVVTREELLEALWKDRIVSESALSGCLKAARKATGDSGREQKVIKTVHGRGYQYIAPVSETIDGRESEVLTDSGNSPGRQVRAPHEQAAGPSILVMPFANMSSDPGDEYFAVGITDEIRLDLCRFRSVLVIARDSSMELKSTDPVPAARQLGVEYVLSGSVQRSGDKVRVSAKLQDSQSSEQIWADRYDRKMKDSFEVQDELAQKIITMLVGRIETTSRERAMRKPPESLTAYDYLLKGNYLFDDWNGSQENLDQAEEMYKEAIKLEPDFADAYIGLASVYAKRLDVGWAQNSKEAGDAALRYARRAVELDEHNGSAHRVLAIAYFFSSSFDQATSQISIALELNPNDYHSYCFGGWISTCAGNLEEGMRCSAEAMQRSPLLPDDCLWTVGITEYLLAHYDRAIHAFGRMVSPVMEINAFIAGCHAQKGDMEKAASSAAAFLAEAEQQPGAESVQTREYWEEMLDFKDPARFELLLDGFQKSGILK